MLYKKKILPESVFMNQKTDKKNKSRGFKPFNVNQNLNDILKKIY